MKHKGLILTIIIIAILIAGGFCLYYYRNSVTDAGEQTESNLSQTQNQIIALESKNITDETKPFSIDITYPYVEGLNDFNSKIEDIVNNELAEFKQMSLENDNAVKQTDPEGYAKYPREYYFSMNYDHGLVDQDIISIVFTISDYTGGAHGANYFKALNYDLKNKKEIQLANLFLGQPDYLQNISIYCITDLKRQIKNLTGDDGGAWIEIGAGPNAENFSVFLINADSIAFYFPQYQVAAYALGDFKVVMQK